MTMKAWTRISLLLLLLLSSGLLAACVPAEPGTAGPSPAPALATPVGPSGMLYVATAGDKSVVAIDLATLTLVNEISVDPSTPHGLAIDPGGQRLYAGNLLGNTIKVIDTATRQVVDILNVGTRSHHIQLSQEGHKLYITPMGGTRFYIYDLVTGEKTTLTVGMGAQDVAVSPDGRAALVASTGFVPASAAASVSVIDLLNEKVLAIVPLPPAPPPLIAATDHAIFSPNGKLGYIVDRGADRLLLLDLSSNTWTDEVAVGTAPHGVAATNDGQKIYVGNQGADTLSVIDARTFTVMATITVGQTPDHLTLDRSGRFLFIPIRGDITIQGDEVMKVLDISTDQIVDEIAVGRDLHVSVQSR